MNGENNIDDSSLYDPALLSRLENKNFKGVYKDGVQPLSPGENLVIRPLQLEDFDRGYIDLLRQLTSVGDVTKDKFEARFKEMQACKNTYFITVVEDTVVGQVIGSASLIIEQKFIHETASKGRVEDVVVSELYRGRQLGKVLVDVLVALSTDLNCYKISLECNNDKLKFYSLFGFEQIPGMSYMQQKFFV